MNLLTLNKTIHWNDKCICLKYMQTLFSFGKLNFYKYDLNLKPKQKMLGISIRLQIVSVSFIKFCEFPEFVYLDLHNMQHNRNEKLPNTKKKYLDIIFRDSYSCRQKLYLIV